MLCIKGDSFHSYQRRIHNYPGECETPVEFRSRPGKHFKYAKNGGAEGRSSDFFLFSFSRGKGIPPNLDAIWYGQRSIHLPLSVSFFPTASSSGHSSLSSSLFLFGFVIFIKSHFLPSLQSCSNILGPTHSDIDW